MPGADISKYLNPWKLKRDKQRQRFAELRQRDGDCCSRCRRPLRFDLPPGHDQAPSLESIGPKRGSGSRALDNLCLCHVRCNGVTVDNTAEVQERLRLRAEAAVAAPQRRVAGRR